MRAFIVSLLFICLITFVISCSNESPEEKIIAHLEETVELEKTFEEEQEKINELELKDEELYDEIIQLEIDDFEKIIELADEAIAYLDERHEHLQREQESIESSKAEFLKIEKQLKRLDNEVKEKGDEMYQAMLKRFDAYDHVYNTYAKSIDLTKQLYEKLQDKDVAEKEIVSLITDVNETYEAVFEANDEFNDKTETYNELKKQFYELTKKKE